jgi:Sigma-70, region 4
MTALRSEPSWAALLYRRCAARFAAGQLEDVNPPKRVASAGAAGQVARLDLRQRAVIALVFIGGQSLAQAATTLGVPTRTVISDLSAAADGLRAGPVTLPPSDPNDDPRVLEPEPATVRSRSATAIPTHSRSHVLQRRRDAN